jgi:hypothetical protein
MHAPIVAVFMKRYRVKEKILSGVVIDVVRAIYRSAQEKIIVHVQKPPGKTRDPVKLRFYGVGIENRQAIRIGKNLFMGHQRYPLAIRVQPCGDLSVCHNMDSMNPWSKFLNGPQGV